MGAVMTMTNESSNEVVLAKHKLDYELARFGLGGTLYGSFAALLALVIIVLAQVITGRFVIEGWAFAAMASTIVIAVILYGAFIFNRFVSIEGKTKGASFKTEAGRPK
jgi:hypothetical protein